MGKISSYAPLSVPASDDIMLINDIDNPAESPVTGTTMTITVANLLAAATTGTAVVDWINAALPPYNADPSGAADSTAAIQSALNAAAAGSGVCYLPAGTYQTSYPIAVPPFTTLLGSPASTRCAPHVSAGTGISGTVIQPVAAFTTGIWSAVTPMAAILITDETTGFAATGLAIWDIVANEQHVQSIMIDGSNMSTATGGPSTATGAAINTAGICLWSGPGRTSIDDVMILNMPGWGFIQVGTPTAPSTPGMIRGRNINVRTCGTLSGTGATPGGGFSIHSSDSEWLYCAAYNCYADGFFIYASYDSIWNQCHSEHNNTGNCFTYEATYNSGTVDAGGITFEACTTDGGAGHGFYLYSSSAYTGTSSPPVNIVGGFIRRPGSPSTSAGYAGVCVNGYNGPVVVSGVQVYPGLPDGSGYFSPQYGISCTNNSAATYVAVNGCVLNAATAGVNNDGSAAALTLSPATVFGAGQAGAFLSPPVLYAPGVPLQSRKGYGSASSQYLAPMDRIIAVAPANALAVSHDREDMTTTFTPVSQTAYYQLMQLVAGMTYSNLCLWVDGTAAAGITHGFAAIMSVPPSGNTGTVAAVSADIGSGPPSFAAQTAAIIPLSAPFTAPWTGAYWCGFMLEASTMPSVGAPSALLSGNFSALAPAFCGTGGTGLTSPPTAGGTQAVTGTAGGGFFVWLT